MHQTDSWHTDTTLDIDDTQANVSDCNARQRSHDQEALLAIFLNEPVLHDQDDTSRSLSMRHFSRTPPCEPGSDVPPDWFGSWNQIKLRKHFHANRRHPKPVARSVVKHGHT